MKGHTQFTPKQNTKRLNSHLCLHMNVVSRILIIHKLPKSWLSMLYTFRVYHNSWHANVLVRLNKLHISQGHSVLDEQKLMASPHHLRISWFVIYVKMYIKTSLFWKSELQAIGPHEDLLTTVKRRKLKWYGHVTRSTWLAKTILQGTVQQSRRRGRQKRRLEDNIPEWTGIALGAAMRREEWRGLVARSSVAPQQSTTLRDRWRWNGELHLTIFRNVQ